MCGCSRIAVIARANELPLRFFAPLRLGVRPLLWIVSVHAKTLSRIGTQRGVEHVDAQTPFRNHDYSGGRLIWPRTGDSSRRSLSRALVDGDQRSQEA